MEPAQRIVERLLAELPAGGIEERESKSVKRGHGRDPCHPVAWIAQSGMPGDGIHR